MAACRWASYIGEPMANIEEEREVLPEDQQVARGHELMQLLGGQQPPTPSKAVAEKMDWNVIVKKGFIEVVIPEPCTGARRRTVSDSALPCFERFEKQFDSIEEAEELSDASTNVSVEAGLPDLDANCLSSEGEAETEAFVQPALAYGYVESWWMPTANQPAMCLDQALAGPTGFVQAPMSFSASPFVPAQWADQTTAECYNTVDTYAAESEEWRTTVMIRNMPNNYTREMFLEMVDSMGFAGTYDFAYLPVDFQNQAGLGYAFINFVSVAHAQLCFETFEGFSNWIVPSEKVCTVTWSSPTQGLEEHLDRYRNSPVMHHSLPDEWKPVLLQQGIRVTFPLPTKPIKTPKVRQHPSAKSA